MKLRSYLRGIGVGILVASAVFLVSEMGEGSSSMTDAQIIAKAKELGMVEGPTTVADYGDGVIVTPDIEYIDEIKSEDPQENIDVTADIDDKNVEVEIEAIPTKEIEEEPVVTEESVPTVEPTPEPTPEPTVAPTKELEPTVAPTKAPEPTKETKPTKAPEPTKAQTNADSSDIIVVVVNPGEGSDTVAKRVYEQGLVKDAHEFDVFLMENGYDRTITTGNHKISKGATYDEIGRNLVSSTK